MALMGSPHWGGAEGTSEEVQEAVVEDSEEEVFHRTQEVGEGVAFMVISLVGIE